MNIGNFILNFFLSLTSSAAILVGVFAMVGAAILRKRFVELVVTFFKTAIGFTIVSQGAGIIGNVLGHFQVAFSGLTNGLDGVIANNDATAASFLAFGPGEGNSLYLIAQLAAIVYVLAFGANICLALITKNSNIYTTGQVALYFTICICSVASLMFDLTSASGYVSALVFCVLFMGLYMSISGTYTRKWMMRTFQRDGVTIGNTGSLGHAFGGLIGDFIARIDKHKPYRSSEKIRFPKGLEVFNNTFISTTTVILLIFLAVYIPMGIIFTWTNASAFTPQALASIQDATQKANLSGVANIFNKTNFIALAIIDAITFTAGIEIVNFGVSLFVGSIIASFKGISEKLVKGAAAGLDTPTTFPYAPNGVLLGFIFSILGSITVLFLSLILSVSTRFGDGNKSLFPIILPAVVPHFYNGGVVGVFANTKGGVKGVIVAAYLHGFALSFVPVAFYGSGLVPGINVADSLPNRAYATLGMPFAQNGNIPMQLPTIWGDSDYFFIAIIAAFSLGINQGQWVFLGIMVLVIILLSGYKYIQLSFSPKQYYRKVLFCYNHSKQVYESKVVWKSIKNIPQKTTYIPVVSHDSLAYSRVVLYWKKNELQRKVLLT